MLIADLVGVGVFEVRVRVLATTAHKVIKKHVLMECFSAKEIEKIVL